jgi:predicted amidophosphoribosyltransferase
MADESTERECPFCKESIKAVAVICHYCQSGITPADPGHGGTCPFCAEPIKEGALKCRHCKSFLGPVPAEARLRTTIPESCASRCSIWHMPGTQSYYMCLEMCEIFRPPI